jgi:hypothetical protein
MPPLHERGFLSKDVESWIKKHRAINHEWFELAEDINFFSNKNLYGLSMPKRSAKHLLVITAYLRCLSQYQGAILLVERGMIYEAATLARGLVESIFVLCAAANSSEFAIQYIDSYKFRNYDLVRKMLFASEEIRKTIEATKTKEELDRKLQKLKAKGIKNFTIAEIAEKANLVELYRTSYSFLSLMAAHPSPNSLDKYFEVDSDGETVSLLYGPDVKGIDKILSVVIESTIIAIERVAELFEQSWHQKVEEFKSNFRKLSEKLSDFSIGQIVSN